MQACNHIWLTIFIEAQGALADLNLSRNGLELIIPDLINIRAISVIEWIVGLVIILLILQCYFLIKRRSLNEIELKRYKSLVEFHRKRDQAIENLLDQQEEEFEQLARQVNDHLGGLIVTALVHLQHLFKPKVTEQDQDFQKLEEIMIKACDEARSIAHQSMPEALFHLGIKEAIEDLVINLQDDSTLINTHFQGIETLSLKKHTIWMIFLAIKELIQHLSSKADISRLEFTFTYKNGNAQIHIVDDATQSKLDLSDPDHAPYPLKRIKSKIDYLGGEMNYHSTSEFGGNNIAIQFAA